MKRTFDWQLPLIYTACGAAAAVVICSLVYVLIHTTTPASTINAAPLASPVAVAGHIGADAPPITETEDKRMPPDMRQLMRWIAASNDAKGMPFVIIDKQLARLYIFDGKHQLQATSAVLLGSAHGDDTVPGIGERPIEDVRPEERTTPAGRFETERGRNLRGEDVVWVDYDAAVSMHRVLTTKPEERRVERLATPTPSDNRISYGCINVPAAFFDQHITPLFAAHKAIVYILPEEKTLAQVFAPMAARYAHESREQIANKDRSMDALMMLLLARRVSH